MQRCMTGSTCGKDRQGPPIPLFTLNRTLSAPGYKQNAANYHDRAGQKEPRYVFAEQ